MSAIPEIIDSLPILPLESVLFPRVAIRLHVLEPAYQAMMARCQQAQEPFGVVLLRHAKTRRQTAPRMHDIGCTAQIRSLQALPGGRQKLIGVGGERFHIRSLSTTEGLIRAQVELIDFEASEGQELQSLGARLRPWVREYFQILIHSGQRRQVNLHLPKDPVSLGFLAATVIDIPSREKQHLLTTCDSNLFFRTLILAYRREIDVLQTLLSRGLDHVLNSFPLN